MVGRVRIRFRPVVVAADDNPLVFALTEVRSGTILQVWEVPLAVDASLKDVRVEDLPDHIRAFGLPIAILAVQEASAADPAAQSQGARGGGRVTDRMRLPMSMS